ncbi:MAG: hypothetical protein RL508_1173 [Actinomycetota bacterium]|jgi:uncharacterized protein YcaQ
MLNLSTTEARQLSLNTLGLNGNLKTPLDVVDRLGLLQIDSVNVFERAHFMPVFSRVGAFEKDSLGLFATDVGSQAPERHFVEYWAHEASIIPVENLPLYKWRMDAAKNGEGRWATFAAENKPLLKWILAEITDKGPLTVAQIEHDRNKRQGTWWGWSDVKLGLEWLFITGKLTSAGRDNFSRRYALPQQVLPTPVLDALKTSKELPSRKALIRQAIDALGVATQKDIADYHRQKAVTDKSGFKQAFDELVEAGELTPVKVQGWKDKAFLGNLGRVAVENDPEFKRAPANRTTILSPFDPVIWFRDRAQRLFGFDYKIEIYVPAEKRVYGYYTLPILRNGHLVGRVDLKSDRQAGVLRVQAAWVEAGIDPLEAIALGTDLARHLISVRSWQGLKTIEVEPVGTLAHDLNAGLRSLGL